MIDKFFLDTNIFRPFFNFYTPYEYFPMIWEGMDELLEQGRLLSVDDVKTELNYQLQSHPLWLKWRDRHSDIFLNWTQEAEMFLQTQLFTIERFRLTNEDILKNKTRADPFLVAEAWKEKGCVVTDEKTTTEGKGIKIPDMCAHFKVQCINRIDFIGILIEKKY